VQKNDTIAATVPHIRHFQFRQVSLSCCLTLPFPILTALLEYFHTATGFTCKSDIAVRRKVNGVACVIDVGAVQQLTELVVDEYSGVVRTFDSDTLSDHILPDPIPCGFTAVKGNFGGISGKHREAVHTAAARPIAQIKGGCRYFVRIGLFGDLYII